MNFKVIETMCGKRRLRTSDCMSVKLLWGHESFVAGSGRAPRECAVSGLYDTVVVNNELLEKLAPFNSRDGAKPDLVKESWTEYLGSEDAASHMLAVLLRAGILEP